MIYGICGSNRALDGWIAYTVYASQLVDFHFFLTCITLRFGVFSSEYCVVALVPRF